tara:strand:+ start:5608 stop:5832 length:225 start_codon:yes stop_codon:yes gene_type:complete
MVVDMKLHLSEKKDKWYIVHYLKENFGDFSTYQPRKFKDSKEILARGSILAMHNNRKQLLEFTEYKGKVYTSLG